MKLPLKSMDELTSEWDKDSSIDQTELSFETARIPKLHAKYLNIMSTHNLIVKSINNEIAKEKALKTSYYRGDLTHEELQAHNLEPMNRRYLKSDIPPLVESDDKILKLIFKKSFHEEIVSYCIYVMKELNNRTWQLKNMIEWNRFTQGG